MSEKDGPCCMACNGPLSWEAPGVYWCHICTVADRHGKTIEEVRRDAEPDALDCDWPPVNRKQVAWEREQAEARDRG